MNTQQLISQGSQYHRNRQWAYARQCYEQALANEPANTQVALLLASLLLDMGEIQQADKLTTRLLKKDKQNGEAHHLAGLIYLNENAFHKAEKSFKQAIKIRPQQYQAHANLAKVYTSLNKPAKALAEYRRCIKIDPGNPHTYYQSSLLELSLNNTDQAIELLQQSILIRPTFMPAYEQLAKIYFRNNDYDRVIYTCQLQLEYSSNKAFVLNNMALAYQANKQYTQARDAYQQSLSEQPDNAHLYINLASLDLLENKPEDAAKHCHTAIALQADNAIAYNNLGNALQWLKDIPGAINAYLTAIKLIPDYADAHLNLAYAYLRKGDYISGWKQHEWRLKTSDHAEGAPVSPDIDDIKAGMRVLIQAEQGIGDTIQFVRFITVLKDRTDCLIDFQINRKTKSLFANCSGVDNIITTTDSDPRPDYDLTLSLMSLPRILSLDRQDIAGQPPSYLKPSYKNLQQWRDYFDNGKFNVGIAWAGNPEQANDHNRSTGLSGFLDLATIPHVNLVSLQYDNNQKQLDKNKQSNAITDLGRPWDEAASIIKHLDLVISVDTSIAHLAGAIGTPTWVILSYYSDWRWLTEQDDSPWYPCMKLIRQQHQNDWPELFTRVYKLLNQLSAAHFK